MSRLYDTLNALERRAQSVKTTDLPVMRAASPARRRYRWPAVAVLAIVVAGAAALTVVPRGGSSALPSSPAIQNAVREPVIPAVSVLRERAREATFLGSLAQAEELLRQAVTVAPADAEAWTDLGVVLVRRKQTRRGIDAFERSISLDRNNATAHRNLAIALDSEGQASAAAVHYRAFLALAPQHPDRARVQSRLAGGR
jgi:tetratricopeptide (TPR) repeat protein